MTEPSTARKLALQAEHVLVCFVGFAAAPRHSVLSPIISSVLKLSHVKQQMNAKLSVSALDGSLSAAPVAISHASCDEAAKVILEHQDRSNRVTAHSLDTIVEVAKKYFTGLSSEVLPRLVLLYWYSDEVDLVPAQSEQSRFNIDYIFCRQSTHAMEKAQFQFDMIGQIPTATSTFVPYHIDVGDHTERLHQALGYVAAHSYHRSPTDSDCVAP